MLSKWLQENKRIKAKPSNIEVIDVTENLHPCDEIMEYLGKEVLNSYRRINDLKRTFSSKSRVDLEKYLEEIVFPKKIKEDRFRVRQGDFGEIISRLIIERFRDLNVPFYKFRWKYDNKKSSQLTDIFAHNKVGGISDLNFYEVKTSINPKKSLGEEAHRQLQKDKEENVTIKIAEFLRRFYESQANSLNDAGNSLEAEKYWELANRYGDIILNHQNYKHYFEIILVLEKEKYSEEIITKIKEIEKKLDPLSVTIILIDNLETLVETSFDKAKEHSCNSVFGV